MTPSTVSVFLSTGRCGTQWLTETLRELYDDSLVVRHEPIGPLYSPRRHFRCYERPDAVLAIPEVREHVEWVESLDRPYVETGWPLFAALPLFATRFGDRLRVVHLTRHPVPSALSHLAHSSYAGSARDDAYTRLATLGPGDPNVFQSDYAPHWDWLDAYEKCLFWCTEVALFGLEFERRFPGVRFLRVKAEEMLSGDRETLARLVAHLELSWDERWLERTAQRVDRWNHRTDHDVDPLAITRHPRATEAAHALGYSLTEVDVEALTSRYRGTPDEGLDRMGRFESASSR